MRFISRVAACGLLATAAATLAAAEIKPWSGRQPPALELKDLSGRTHRLSDYRGKVLLVNFWATWCEPCREEMPAIEKLKERFSGRPFMVLAVNVDEPEARIHKFLSQVPLRFTVLLDPGRRLSKAWNVRVLPSTFLIAPDGGIRYAVVGELDWNAQDVADRVAKLLPER